ncbi:MAG TPA: PAS domain S-box protein, partial [Spirochaetia bacterium]|nr:PAS domain S-box protein [Spirochaetia bacterium]
VQERTIKLTEANLELFLLNQVRTALAREAELSAVLKTIVETVAETLGYSMVGLYLLQKDQLVLQYDVGYERRFPCISISSGVTGRVARTGTSALVGDARLDPDFITAVEGVASEVAVPLLDQGSVEGVLSVESMRRDAFDESDLHLLTEVADYAAIAIVRARFFSLMRESEERYRRLIETSPDAIVLTNAELAILIANQKAAELYGYDSVDQLSNLRARDFVGLADRDRFDLAVRDVLASGAVVSMELTLARRGGKEIPVELSASAVTGPQGAFAGFLIIARDITQRKHIEAELREYQEELERRVEERTSALQESQERLRQAEKMEAIGRLAGGVAHDFNNMLMVIMGHGQMLLETEDIAGDRRRELAAMLESAERAASLTHQLLTFSRQQLVEAQALDLNAVIDGMSDMVSRLVGQHVRLDFRPGSELWSVLSDKVQMEQVVLNLAANAADAMKNGGVIEIETSNVRVEQPIPLQLELVPPGRYVLFRFKDSGEGMPAEVQEHVFEPFFTTKEKGKGTGLGLATVYGIVKQAKGFISLESAPGQGATFRIYLPAYELDAVAEQGSEGVKQAPGGTESILVVDDQDEVRDIAVLMLRNLGYTVYEAGGGNEALALLGRLTRLPDLVITDVSMPDLTGPALMRQLFSAGTVPKTIYMSGYGRDAFDRTMTDAVFLQKPFSALTLALAVRNVLDSDDTHIGIP